MCVLSTRLLLEAETLRYLQQPMDLACLSSFGKLPNHGIALFSVLENELLLFFYVTFTSSGQLCSRLPNCKNTMEKTPTMTEADILKLRYCPQHLEITCKEFKSITIHILLWISKTPQQSMFYSSRKKFCHHHVLTKEIVLFHKFTPR